MDKRTVLVHAMCLASVLGLVISTTASVPVPVSSDVRIEYRSRLGAVDRSLRLLFTSSSQALNEYNSLNAEFDARGESVRALLEADPSVHIDRGLFCQLYDEASRSHTYIGKAIDQFQTAITLLGSEPPSPPGTGTDDQSSDRSLLVWSIACWRSRRSFAMKRLTKLLLFASKEPVEMSLAAAKRYQSVTAEEYASAQQRTPPAIDRSRAVPVPVPVNPLPDLYWHFLGAAAGANRSSHALVPSGLPPDWPALDSPALDAVEALCNHALIRIRTRNYDTAIDLLKRAHSIVPDHPFVSLHLALSYKLVGRPTESLALFQSVFQTDELPASASDVLDIYGQPKSVDVMKPIPSFPSTSPLESTLGSKSWPLGRGRSADYRIHNHRAYTEYLGLLRSEAVGLFASYAPDSLVSRLEAAAVTHRVWPSAAQQPINPIILNPPLRAKPFWSVNELSVELQSYVSVLEQNWKVIRSEVMPETKPDASSSGNQKKRESESVPLSSKFVAQTEVSLPAGQNWKQLVLWHKGQKHTAYCERQFKRVCKLLAVHLPEATGNFGGFIKFSALTAGTHVPAHFGPHNARLRLHLGVVVPPDGTAIRINSSSSIDTWHDGRVLIIDDSFRHEVWYDHPIASPHTQPGETAVTAPPPPARIILIVDAWHPDLPDRFRRDSSLGMLHPAINFDYYF